MEGENDMALSLLGSEREGRALAGLVSYLLDNLYLNCGIHRTRDHVQRENGSTV